jgi:hypothetical protein
VQGELLRVIASGQSTERGGVELTILSVELYSDGVIVHSLNRLLGEKRFGLETVRGPRGPEPTLQVKDDVGTGYLHHPARGGGDDRRWTLVHMLWPAVPVEARTLTITVPEIVVRHYRPELVPPDQEERLPGPWTFPIAIGGSRTKPN